jgi:poly-gamma-glutamate capsule biosynthesis protein CapA/YwtB (metallophosphatase superfamily)
VIAVGDFMPGSSYPAPLLLPEKKLEEISLNIKFHMPEADIRLFNLEGALIDGGKPAKKVGKAYHFAIPSRYGKFIKVMGFNVASINNNHILDFGWKGLLNTIRVLESQGIKYAGLKGKSAEFFVGGKKISVIAFGFINSDKFYSILDIAEAKRVVEDLKKKHDIVIVSFHGGKEGYERTSNRTEIFLNEKRGNLFSFCRGVIDAGADLVIGHGPHLPRALELYKGKLIAYSLGNFFTYGRFNVRGAFGLAPMLYVVLDEGGNLKEGRIIPFRQVAGGIPILDKGGEVIRWMERLTKLDFPSTHLIIEKSGVIKVKQHFEKQG